MAPNKSGAALRASGLHSPPRPALRGGPLRRAVIQLPRSSPGPAALRSGRTANGGRRPPHASPSQYTARTDYYATGLRQGLRRTSGPTPSRTRPHRTGRRSGHSAAQWRAVPRATPDRVCFQRHLAQPRSVQPTAAAANRNDCKLGHSARRAKRWSGRFPRHGKFVAPQAGRALRAKPQQIMIPPPVSYKNLRFATTRHRCAYFMQLILCYVIKFSTKGKSL